MRSVTLLIYEYDDRYIKTWNSTSGLVFSGDAETREEAEIITKKNLESASFHIE